MPPRKTSKSPAKNRTPNGSSLNDAETTLKLGPVLDFMRLLWAVDHGLQSTSKRMESELGTTGPQRLVIRIVGRFPGISAGRVAEILHLHPSTLTGILRRLEQRRIIERRPDPEDARRALLYLSARGKTLGTVSSGTVESAVRRVLGKMPAGQVTAAREVLQALSQALESP